MQLKVSENDEGQRLDRYLADRLEISRGYAVKLIEEGQISPAHNKKYRVKVGEEYEVEMQTAQEIEVEAIDLAIPVLYEDEDILVIDKPAGVSVHPSGSDPDPTVVHWLKYYLDQDLPTINGVNRPGIIHRLDKYTSGVLVVGKSEQGFKGVAKQFEEREVVKKYTALVSGAITPPTARIDSPIDRSTTDPARMMVSNSVRAREAITEYKLLEQRGKYSLLDVRIYTGRTHQIRVHLAAIGYPVVGDTVYGRSSELSRPFLHARELTLRSPSTGQSETFTAPLASKLEQFWGSLEIG